VNSNRLTRRDATSAIVAEMRQRFAGRLRDRDEQVPGSGANVRLLEKTPKNALRVPFLLGVSGRAVHLPAARAAGNLSSMMQAWRAKGWITLSPVAGLARSLVAAAAARLRTPAGPAARGNRGLQWRVANETILDDLADLPRERWINARYEDVLRDPRAQIVRLLEFMGLSMDARLEEYLSKPLPRSRYTQTAPDPEKWKKNAAEIERVLPALAGISARLRALPAYSGSA
jgi:hypothetical protein